MTLEFINGALLTPNGFEIPRDAYYNHQCEIINEELKVYTFLDGRDVPLVESRLIDILESRNKYRNKISLMVLKNDYNGIMLKGYERVIGIENFLNRHKGSETNTNMELISVKLVSKNTGEVIKLI